MSRTHLTPSAIATVIALLLVIGAFALSPTAVSAAEPVVTNMQTELPDRITVGDRFTYVITAEVDTGTTVSVAPSGLPEALRQTGRVQTETRSLGNNRSQLTLRVELAAFMPGEIEVPPIRLRARSPGGATTDFSTPASTVRVVSVLPPQGGVLTPKDLKPQAEIGTTTPIALYATLAGLAIALALVVGLLLWRMRRLARPVEAPGPVEPRVEPPEDRARRVIDGAAGMLAARDYNAFYSTLATTIRTYLTERFGFPAFALTTSQLQENMVREGMDRWQARLVAGLLNQCDSVVFAQYRPAPDRADADLTAAYEIIEMSRPVEREEATVS